MNLLRELSARCLLQRCASFWHLLLGVRLWLCTWLPTCVALSLPSADRWPPSLHEDASPFLTLHLHFFITFGSAFKKIHDQLAHEHVLLYASSILGVSCCFARRLLRKFACSALNWCSSSCAKTASMRRRRRQSAEWPPVPQVWPRCMALHRWHPSE